MATSAGPGLLETQVLFIPYEGGNQSQFVCSGNKPPDYFAIPGAMDALGIETRSIRKMSGEYGFSEVLFNDVAKKQRRSNPRLTLETDFGTKGVCPGH